MTEQREWATKLNLAAKLARLGVQPEPNQLAIEFFEELCQLWTFKAEELASGVVQPEYQAVLSALAHTMECSRKLIAAQR